MPVIYETVLSFENFVSLDNAHPLLKKSLEDDPKKIIQYLSAINNLPLTWEDWVTPFKEITPVAMNVMASYAMEEFTSNKIPVEFTNQTYKQLCHYASAHYYKEYKGAEFYSGFSTIDGDHAVGNDWHWHTFLVYQGKILETTPMKRDRYFGVKFSNPAEFFEDGFFDKITKEYLDKNKFD